MPQLSKRASEMPPSPIRRLRPYARQARQEGKSILHLNIGQPDIKTPEEFLRGVPERPGYVSYSPSRGIEGLMEPLQDYYSKPYPGKRSTSP